MKEGTKAEDTKPKHTDDHTDNPQMNTLTNTLTNRPTCQDDPIEGKVEPVEGEHGREGYKAKTH